MAKIILSGICLLCLVIFIGCGDDKAVTNPEPDLGTVVTDQTQGNVLEFHLSGDFPYFGQDVVQANDRSFIILGRRAEDFYLARISSTGDIVWEKTFGGSQIDYPKKVALTADGNIIFAGYTSSYGTDQDFYLAKVNMNGQLIWQKTYDNDNDEICYDMIVVPDGYVMCGSTHLGANVEDFYVVKTDLNGDVVWDNSFGSTGDQVATSVSLSHNNELIVAGYTEISASRWDIYVLNLHADGHQLEELIHGADNIQYTMRAMVKSNDDNFVIVGHQQSGETLTAVKINENLGIIWEHVYTNPAIYRGLDIVANTDGTFSITGDYNGLFSDGHGGYLTELDADGLLIGNYSDSAYVDCNLNAIIETDNGHAIIGEFVGSWQILLMER